MLGGSSSTGKSSTAGKLDLGLEGGLGDVFTPSLKIGVGDGFGVCSTTFFAGASLDIGVALVARPVLGKLIEDCRLALLP